MIALTHPPSHGGASTTHPSMEVMPVNSGLRFIYFLLLLFRSQLSFGSSDRSFAEWTELFANHELGLTWALQCKKKCIKYISNDFQLLTFKIFYCFCEDVIAFHTATSNNYLNAFATYKHNYKCNLIPSANSSWYYHVLFALAN